MTRNDDINDYRTRDELRTMDDDDLCVFCGERLTRNNCVSDVHDDLYLIAHLFCPIDDETEA